MLFRDDDFEHEIVGNFHACGRGDVAAGFHVGFYSGAPLVIDRAAVGIEIRFPTAFGVIAGQSTNILMHNALAFPANLVCMFRTCSTDYFALFLYTPIQSPNAPAAFDISQVIVDYACEGELNGELADGVNDRGEDDADREVGGREDADGGFVAGGHQGALNGEGPGNRDTVGKGGNCLSVKDIVDAAKDTVRGRRHMSREQVGKGEGMDAVLEVVGFVEEFPIEENGIFGGAGRTVFVDWLSEGDAGQEVHLEGLKGYVGIGDCEEERTGHEGARGLSSRAVKEQGR